MADGPVQVLRTSGVTSTTGPVVAFQTTRSLADAEETRHARWIIARKSVGGPRLLARLQADLRDGGVARLKAGVAASTQAGGRLPAFTLVDYGVTAKSHQLPG